MEHALSPALVAHKGLRGRILLELKRDQPLVAKQLAERYDVSANAVRRHLKELEAEGLVEHVRERRGRGAPTHAFRLTAAGEALFPRRYEEALTDVLAYVAATAGRDRVREIFAERFRGAAARLRRELDGAPFERRLDAVVEHLSREGFMAEWSAGAGEARIAEHNCAVQLVAERFPEICDAEADFLRETLNADVRREAYIPDGCNACRYAVSVAAVAPAEER